MSSSVLDLEELVGPVVVVVVYLRQSSFLFATCCRTRKEEMEVGKREVGFGRSDKANGKCQIPATGPRARRLNECRAALSSKTGCQDRKGKERGLAILLRKVLAEWGMQQVQSALPQGPQGPSCCSYSVVYRGDIYFQLLYFVIIRLYYN